MTSKTDKQENEKNLSDVDTENDPKPGLADPNPSDNGETADGNNKGDDQDDADDPDIKQKASEARPSRSLDARLERAQETLDDAIDAQNQVNKLVADATAKLDKIIDERDGGAKPHPQAEILNYLNSQQHRRTKEAVKRKNLEERGINLADFLKNADTRAPIDKKPAVNNKPKQGSVRPAAK